MFYSHPCSYCSKLFYTFNESKFEAAKTLYAGIKHHLTEYDEDHKEFDFDDGPSVDTDEVYNTMAESNEEPSGGYQL